MGRVDEEGQIARGGRAGLSRRALIGGALAAIGSGALPRTARARAGRRGPGAPPRHWIQIVPVGGVDAAYSVEPRTQRGLAKGVEIPFPASSIVTTRQYPLAPPFRALAPWTPKLALVTGFLVDTANHYQGLVHTSRLRTHAVHRTPSIFEAIGDTRAEQAVGTFHIGVPYGTAATPRFLGSGAVDQFGTGPDLLQMMDDVGPDECASIAVELAGRRDALRGRRPSLEEASAIDALDQASRLFARLAEVPRFAATPTPEADATIEKYTYLAERLQRALWLVEHDLAACVQVFTSLSWDSHFNNGAQATMNAYLANCLATFFADLERRSGRAGRLADTTAVMVLSEIGRHPALNAMNGKDHFPQVPALLYGRWFATGRRFGAADEWTASRPVSLATGRADASGRRLLLDDLGATALALHGIDPATVATPGVPLGFVI